MKQIINSCCSAITRYHESPVKDLEVLTPLDSSLLWTVRGSLPSNHDNETPLKMYILYSEYVSTIRMSLRKYKKYTV